jgi:hypothetical protein
MAKPFLIALQALAAALSALPGIEGEVAAAFAAVSAAVTRAIAAHNQAQASVDPSQLIPETPVE